MQCAIAQGKWIQRTSNWRIYATSVLGILALVVGVLYSPTVDANFQGDDFRYISYLFFNFKTLLAGRGWVSWISTSSGWGPWKYVRPLFQFSYLLDYMTWGLNPIGYHISSLVLHILTAFLVVILCWQITRHCLTAAIAGMLFAIMPIHVEAVSWFGARAEVLSTLWYLITVVFFILFRQRGRGFFLFVSVGAFIMTLLAQETAITLPLVLILYDWIYHRERIRKTWWAVWQHLPFWGILLVYLVIRVSLWGQGGTYIGSRLLKAPWDYISQVYFLGLVDPLLSDMTGTIRWVLVGLALLMLFAYHSRREVLWGSGWAIITMAPLLLTLDQFIFDRYFYLPTIGLSIVLASILIRSFTRFTTLSRAVSVIGLAVLFVIYGTGLYVRNEAWARAAQITQLVTQQVLALQPRLPSDARLVFTDVPVLVGGRGMQAFGGKLDLAMQLVYNNPKLEVYDFTRFPLWLDRLDRTYFFQYDRRQITERADLVQALEQRNQCGDFSTPILTWNFSDDAQGWEPWNQLASFEIRDGTLMTRSQGSDPYMASPPIDIPSMAIGNIEVTMRVWAAQRTLQGTVYWLGTGQQDFSPALKVPFPVQADGELHTYKMDIAKSGELLMGDRILRLRLDPANAPANLSIQQIQVFSHCSTLQSDRCECPH
jgi:hypothetical protein